MHWKLQPLAVLDQTPVVQNTYYTVLDTTKNIRVYSIVLRQSNDELAAKTVYVRATVEGVVDSGGSGDTPANFGKVYLRLNPQESTNYFLTGSAILTLGYYVAMEFKSLKIEMRTNTAPGTNQHLYGYVRYATLELIA